MQVKLPLTIKQVRATEYQYYLKHYLNFMPWLEHHEDNLSICIKTYPEYFKKPTADEIQALGKMPYLQYSELSKNLIKQLKNNLYLSKIKGELYLEAMAKVHQQLLLVQGFEAIFTGIGSYSMNSKEKAAGLDFAKKYDEYAALLNLCDGDPLKIKELEEISVEYIYLCLDYKSEKAAAERKMVEQK